MGKIIAIEGLDKSGKNTASNTIKSFYEDKGFKVINLSFPRYNTEIGKLIRNYLTGKLKLSNYAFECLLAADKLDFQDELARLLKEYDYIILDRYIHSQFAYGGLQVDLEWLNSLLELDFVSYPNLIFYMKISAETSFNRQGKYGENDIYESNIKFLETVCKNYDNIFKDNNNVITINAEKSLDEVTNDILINL